ncbi:hypothetical protein L0128_15190 [candidate division KSB1 bacterium]|nr:hypothetical protein [candidate division KSB1 bacterium]
MQNLQNAVVDKNVENYLYCFTTKVHLFQFIPEQLVKQNNPTVFDAWGLEAERNYFNQMRNFVPQDSICRLVLDEISSEIFADSALLRRRYGLLIHHTSQGNVPRDVRGEADFWIFKEEGYWFIRRWVDIGTAGQPSWSSIKAGF